MFFMFREPYIALSLTLNVLTLGRWGESFCARAFRCWTRPVILPRRFWAYVVYLLDWFFMRVWNEPLHCFDQYQLYRRDTDPIVQILQRVAT